jgi:dephospho-CoA kinase
MTSHKIGIAGYMGSGKTTCAALLGHRGWEIIDADAVAKDLMNHDPGLQQRIGAAFGAEVLVDGALSFALLGKKAFASIPSLAALNAIVHPPLLDKLRSLLTAEGGAVRVLDAALISFWKIESWFDRLCWITASRQLRLGRLAATLPLAPAEIERRMSLQESLFAEPTGQPWDILENGADPDAFVQAVKRHFGLA